MNIKNKILLTIIAIIFAICLFNTNCFASFDIVYDGVTYTKMDLPDECSNYKYNILSANYNSEGVLHFTIFLTNADDCYYNDFNCLRYVSVADNPQAYWSEIALSTYPSLSSTSRIILSTNVDIFDSSGNIVYKSGIIERGTEDNTNTDSGDTGNETIGTDTENTTDSDDSSGILSSIKEGFTNVVNFFTQIIDWLNPFSENFILVKLWDFLTTIIDYINPFSDNFILKNVLDFLGNILSYINPFSENFFGYKIIELLQDLFEFLFIPEENSFTGIIDIVKSKFNFIDTIKISANSLKDLISNVGTAPKLTINVNNNKYGVQEVTLIDLEWYKPYKTHGDLILTGFIYAFFLWRLFISIPNIIHGFGGSVQDSYKITEIKGGKD